MERMNNSPTFVKLFTYISVKLTKYNFQEENIGFDQAARTEKIPGFLRRLSG
jgi:hypothetical protein